MIHSLCLCLKCLGNLKSENNVLTLFSHKFLKPFERKHFLENYLLKFLDLTLLSLREGGGVIFAHGKFKFKLFLNDLWYERETLWLFLTFTRDYTGETKRKKY